MTISVVYDIVLLLLVLILTIRGCQQGFVGTLVRLIGYFAALLGAWILSRPIADYLYEMFIDPVVQEAVALHIQEAGGDLAAGVQQFFAAAPQSVSNALGVAGISLETAMQALDFSGSSVAAQVSHTILMPAATTFLSAILFVVIFSVLWFVVKAIVKVTKLVDHLPLVGGLNRLLGTVLGLACGCILAFLGVNVIRLLSIWLGDSVEFLSPQILSQAPIFHWLSSLRLPF